MFYGNFAYVIVEKWNAYCYVVAPAYINVEDHNVLRTEQRYDAYAGKT